MGVNIGGTHASLVNAVDLYKIDNSGGSDAGPNLASAAAALAAPVSQQPGHVAQTWHLQHPLEHRAGQRRLLRQSRVVTRSQLHIRMQSFAWIRCASIRLSTSARSR